jgi:hypothetical protein
MIPAQNREEIEEIAHSPYFFHSSPIVHMDHDLICGLPSVSTGFLRLAPCKSRGGTGKQTPCGLAKSLPWSWPTWLKPRCLPPPSRLACRSTGSRSKARSPKCLKTLAKAQPRRGKVAEAAAAALVPQPATPPLDLRTCCPAICSSS